MTPDAPSVGTRVVVRHLAGGTGPSGGPALNDVVGRVLEVDERSVTMQRRDGRTAVIARSDIVTWKTVPDRPLRRRRAATIDAEALTRITSRGWPAIESVPLGDWELRASRGFTGRANSVAVHGSPGLPFSDALARLHAFYAEHDTSPLAQVVVGSAAERDFIEAGWVAKRGYRGGAVVQVADLDPSYPGDPDTNLTETIHDEWLDRYERADEDRATARSVLQAPAQVAFISIGRPIVAIGRIVVTGEWAGISAVEVTEDVRRQGLGRRVVNTALAWAVEHGADKAYLQTMRSKVAAVALYKPFGFVDHHDYRYLEPAPGNAL